MIRPPLRLAARLCICLGLVWFLPGFTFPLVGVSLALAKVDPAQLFWILLSTLMIACSLWIWHVFVTWTLGRVLGTATASALVLAQVIAWMPLWNAGCVTVDFLRFGQCSGLAGVWMIAMTYAWWGAGAGIAQWRKRSMSPNARRIIFGIGLIPFVAGGWLVLAIALTEFAFDDVEWQGVLVAHPVGAAVIVTAWVCAWRKEALRSRRAIAWTAGLAVAYIGLVTAAAPLIGFNDLPDGVTVFWLAGPLMLTGLWFSATALLWSRGTTAEIVGPIDVKAALRCRACGYSLVGLSEARCPECGRRQTLDELFEEVIAMQPDV